MAAHWALFFYALADIAAGVWGMQRYLYGKAHEHCTTWQLSRALVSLCAFLAAWDCIRIFAGYYWDGSDSATPPLFAYSIFPLMLVHLVLVPLLMIPLTEYEFSSRAQKAFNEGSPKDGETACEKSVRSSVIVIAVVLAVVGLQTTVQKYRATGITGLRKDCEYGGITGWKLADLETVHELGFWAIPEDQELVGIFAFANYAWVVGALIWYNTGKPAFFLIQLVCLVGQALSGAILKDDADCTKDMFSYGSNILEAVSFAAMVYADTLFWEKLGKTPLADDADALEIARGG